MPKSLKTLIRLAKGAVDKEQEIVGNLQARRDSLAKKWQDLQDSIDKERSFAEENPDLLATFGDFARNVTNKMEKVEKDIVKLDERLEIQREKLREAFAEQKKYEIALENKEAAISKAEKKAEQASLDEMALQGHRRKD